MAQLNYTFFFILNCFIPYYIRNILYWQLVPNRTTNFSILILIVIPLIYFDFSQIIIYSFRWFHLFISRWIVDVNYLRFNFYFLLAKLFIILYSKEILITSDFNDFKSFNLLFFSTDIKISFLNLIGNPISSV